MQEEKIRLNKYMAQAGLCSRREADKRRGQGRVYVNGTVAGRGCLVGTSDKVQIGKKEIKGAADKVAERMNISKVTVYSYLDEIRKAR